ncbi:hypothetical protein TGARI_367150, partial [Toxoplasma gondii ARI]
SLESQPPAHAEKSYRETREKSDLDSWSVSDRTRVRKVRRETAPCYSKQDWEWNSPFPVQPRFLFSLAFAKCLGCPDHQVFAFPRNCLAGGLTVRSSVGVLVRRRSRFCVSVLPLALVFQSLLSLLIHLRLFSLPNKWMSLSNSTRLFLGPTSVHPLLCAASFAALHACAFDFLALATPCGRSLLPSSAVPATEVLHEHSDSLDTIFVKPPARSTCVQLPSESGRRRREELRLCFLFPSHHARELPPFMREKKREQT